MSTGMATEPRIRIRNGRVEEWSVLRLLLPDAVRVGSRVMTVVAEDEEGRIHGALAVQPRMRSEPVPGVRVAVHVIGPSRGKGIARGMIDAIRPWAQERGARALFAWGAVAEASATEKVWRGLGFRESVWIEEGRVDPARALRRLTPIWEEMNRRRWIPAEAEMTSLLPAHVPALMRMHLENFGGDRAILAAQLSPESPTAFDPALCPVLTLKGVPIGYAFTVRTGRNSARVDATAVDAAHRNNWQKREGWANLWLKREGMLRCVALGLETLTFYTYERHGDTRRFSQKSGMTVQKLVEPYRVLE